MDGSKGGGGCLTKIRLPVQQLESAREEGLVTRGGGDEVGICKFVGWVLLLAIAGEGGR